MRFLEGVLGVIRICLVVRPKYLVELLVSLGAFGDFRGLADKKDGL